MKELANPRLVDNTEFGLDKPEKRQEWLKKLRKSPSKIVGILHTIDAPLDIRKTGDGQHGYYYAEQGGDLIIFVKYKKARLPLKLQKAVVQVALWKNMTTAVTNDFMPDLFFGIVLKDNKIVMSDQLHTNYGMEFWKRRLQEAINKKLYVFLWNQLSNLVIHIDSKESLANSYKNAWLEDRKGETLRWIISENKIDFPKNS